MTPITSNTTKRILYAEDVLELRELNKYLLEHYFDVEIVEAENSANAIDILSKDANFDLIISDFVMNGGNGDQIFEHLTSKNIKIPFVLLSGSKLDNYDFLKTVPMYSKPLETNGVFRIVDENLPSVVRRQHQYYVPVSMNLLSMIKSLQTDVFLKINEGKFVKIFRRGTTLESGEIAKHAKKGILTFYIAADQFSNFIGDYQIKLQLAERWTDASALAFNESIMINADLMRNLGERLSNSQKFSEQVIEMVKTAIKLVSMEEQFRFLIKRFEDKEEMSFSEHCALIIYTAATLIQDHASIDFDAAMRSICVAALLHDASLDDRLFKIKRDLISKGIYHNLEKGSEDYKLIYSHPFRAAELARKFQFCPGDVQTIVVQHHEMPRGKGFPLGCESNELHTLSLFFIIAEDFVETYLAYRTNMNIEEYLESRSKIFNDSYFDPAFKALKNRLLRSH